MLFNNNPSEVNSLLINLIQPRYWMKVVKMLTIWRDEL